MAKKAPEWKEPPPRKVPKKGDLVTRAAKLYDPEGPKGYDFNRGTFSNAPKLADGSPDPNKRDMIEFYFRHGMFLEYTALNRPVERPAEPQHAPRVEDLLSRMHLPIRSLYFRLRGQRILPIIDTVEREGAWQIQLSGYDVELRGSPREKIATARRLMLHLLEHEVDEWLWAAGLGEDPHAMHSEADRAMLNQIYEQGSGAI